MMKVIVDTDVGIDDAMSLAYLPACKNVDIVAITLIAGNEQIDVIAPSIEKIATYLGEKSTPLYIGGRYNLGGKWIQTNGYFGQNGLGGIQLPPQEMKVSKKRSSVEALLHYSRKYPKQIHALFIGPLTNFCLAFLADNEFPSRLASIMIMGTDRSDNTIQNVTSHAEFNTWCDPWAYDILKECASCFDTPITIVEWTTCWTSLLPYSMVDDIKALKSQECGPNPYLDLFYKFTDNSNKYVNRNFWNTGFRTADLFVAVGLTHPRIFKSVKKVDIAHVETHGERFGHVDFVDNPHGRLNLVTEVDTDEMARIIIDTLAKASLPCIQTNSTHS